MLSFSLLMLTISGIAAMQSGKSLQSNINTINHNDIDSGNSTRIKRDKNQSVHFTGTLDSFSYSTTYSSRGFFASILPTGPDYYDNKYNITADLNYTSWEKLFSDYTHAALQENIHIEFFRNDQRKGKIVKQVIPKRIKLSEIHTSNTDVEELSYQKNMKIWQSDMADPVISVRDIPFYYYKETIFHESIWFRTSRISAKVHLTLEGYIEDNAMMLKVVYRVSPSFWFSNSGMTIELKNLSNLVLGNW